MADNQSLFSVGRGKPDQSWARYLVLVNITMGFFLGGMYTSFGLIWQLFSDLLDDPTSSRTIWIGSTFFGFSFVVYAVALRVESAKKYAKVCHFAGGGLVFTGMIICTLKALYDFYDTLLILLFYGILAGMGAGIWQISTLLEPNDNFDLVYLVDYSLLFGVHCGIVVIPFGVNHLRDSDSLADILLKFSVLAILNVLLTTVFWLTIEKCCFESSRFILPPLEEELEDETSRETDRKVTVASIGNCNSVFTSPKGSVENLDVGDVNFDAASTMAIGPESEDLRGKTSGLNEDPIRTVKSMECLKQDSVESEELAAEGGGSGGGNEGNVQPLKSILKNKIEATPTEDNQPKQEAEEESVDDREVSFLVAVLQCLSAFCTGLTFLIPFVYLPMFYSYEHFERDYKTIHVYLSIGVGGLASTLLCLCVSRISVGSSAERSRFLNVLIGPSMVGAAVSIAVIPLCKTPLAYLLVCLAYGFCSTGNVRVLFKQLHIVYRWRGLDTKSAYRMASWSTFFAGVGGIVSLPIVKIVMSVYSYVDPMIMYSVVLDVTAGILGIGGIVSLLVHYLIGRKA